MRRTTAAINIIIYISINVIADKNLKTPADNAASPALESTQGNSVRTPQHGQEQFVQLITSVMDALKTEDVTDDNVPERPMTIEFK